ncbi:MAG: type IV pilus modification protein PilV [Steroidobacteraceae bacterium]|jgi:type IV pilus assembly protein PilV
MRTPPTHRASADCRPAVAARTAGFTIVEVLVSLVILSIGLLGIAKLVLYSAHSNDSAYLRSQATQLAYEILDNMRANPTAAAAGNYNTPLAAAATNPGFTCLNTTCPSSSNLALYDVYVWKSRLAAGATGGALPSGQGSVTVTGTTPIMATIIVQWDDAAAQSIFGGTAVGIAAPMSVTLETALHQ